MRVRDIMSSPVETISHEAMITEAAEKMRTFEVGVLPVMKEDEIVGVITDRDIAIRVVAEGLDPQNTPVSSAMSTEVASCSEDTDMEEAASIMEEKKIHRLLVLGNDNTVSGVLSIGDIARKMEDEHLLHEVLGRICEPANVH